MKITRSFEQAYSKLNTEQKLAVDTIEGPVMVIAGPGTGKTQILATRIANILLKTDTAPHAILALTFTESAAQNMKERLISLIGPAAYSVHVQTFHSFCDEVIRSNPEYFPIRHDSQVLSDLERFDIMEELLRNPQLSALRTMNSPFHYLKAIIKSISDLKREGINEIKFAELVASEKEQFEQEKADLKKTELSRREKAIQKMEELSVIFTQYQQQLSARQRYDYDDMIAFVAKALAEHESLLLDYQEKLTYFLVDEYQDTNASQNMVVDLLASYWGENANIFVVGDPHQSIYRFQGASLENTFSFARRYPTATFITLGTGYRCPQVIYNVAAEVIQHNELPEGELPFSFGDALESVQPDGSLIQVHKAGSGPLEIVFIAEEIQNLINRGVKPSEIAVLYRNNADSAELKTALEKWTIPYHTDDGNDALQNDVIQQFLTLCKVIADIRNSDEGYEFFEVMNYVWVNLNKHIVMVVSRAAGKTKMSIFDRIAAGYEEFCKLQFCEEVTAMDFAVLEDFVTKLERWANLDADMTFPEWVELVMKESGYLQWLGEHPQRMLHLHHLNAVLREIRALVLQDRTLNLDKFLKALATMKEHNLKISVEDLQSHDDSVTLSTVHKAKGREWEHVFLMQCVDGKWGNSKAPAGLPLPEGILQHTQLEEKDRNEDDRRLFYVAVTRAKKRIVISYPETVVSGNKPKLTLPSIFLTEISEEFKSENEIKDVSEKVINNPDHFVERLVSMPPAQDYGERERDWLKKVVMDYKLSITGLNSYLRSPQEFFVREILKVPEVKSVYQAFGTAVHAALEYAYKQVQKDSQFPAIESVLHVFETALQREILPEDQYLQRLEYGGNILRQYLEKYQDNCPETVMIEKFFGYGWSKAMLGDISLVGRIDRVDLIDKVKKQVCIVDYKTGRAKSANEIEGKVSTENFSERELELPETVRGPYKRQLLFYKLLTQLDTTFPATATEGVFDFVEPDRDGKFVQRRFSLIDSDVEQLKDLIKEVMAEIRGLKFLEL